MSRTVLIVDDSDMVRRMVSFKLKSAGYTILVGEDGDEALTYFDGKDIDLVITDLNMPNKDGLELIKEIRAKQEYKFLPVILFLSDHSTDVKEFIKSSGATMFFDKDSIKEKLVSTVKKMIG